MGQIITVERYDLKMSWLEELYYVLYALAAACGIALISVVALALCGVITCSAGGGILCCTMERRVKHPDGTVSYETCCQSCCGCSCCGDDPEHVVEVPANQITPVTLEQPSSVPDDVKMTEDLPPAYQDAM